jgi:hypothetical protein
MSPDTRPVPPAIMALAVQLQAVIDARCESALDRARRHVQDGEARVERQREILAKLAERKHATDRAERLLKSLQDLQRLFVHDMERRQRGQASS